MTKNNKNLLYLVIGIFILIVLSQGNGEPAPTPLQPIVPQVGCTNTCATGFNQNPYPDCNCYLVETTDNETAPLAPTCTDNDPDQDLFFKGTCTPIDGVDEDDLCPTDTAVTQLFCSEDGLSCMGASFFCPIGASCSDGACVEFGAVVEENICVGMIFMSYYTLHTSTIEECRDIAMAHCESLGWSMLGINRNGTPGDNFGCCGWDCDNLN